MRNIYTDEAGTAANEAVSVVVGLIVNPDTQWFPVIAAMATLYQGIPQQYRGGFAFHARKLIGENKYPGWDYEERKEFMRRIMMLPRKFRVPLAVGAARRGAMDWSQWPEKTMSPAMVDHMWAFTVCIGTCNRYLADECTGELGQVIAEDLPQMPKYLRRAVNILHVKPLVLKTVTQAPGTAREHEFRGDRLIDEVHFLDRSNAPFLQLADACAFGIRRYITGHDAEGFAEAIFAEEVPGLKNPSGLYAAIFSHKDDEPIP